MKYLPFSYNRISNFSQSLTQIIKNWGFFCVLLLFFWSCENRGPSSQKKTPTHKAQEIIDQAIIAHGQHLFENSTLSFLFRDKQYSARRSDPEYIYTRSFKDGSALIEDILINSTDFSRKKNGIENNNFIEDKYIFIIFIFIKEVSKKAYRSHLIALYIVISSINLPNIGRMIQDQFLN